MALYNESFYPATAINPDQNSRVTIVLMQPRQAAATTMPPSQCDYSKPISTSGTCTSDGVVTPWRNCKIPNGCSDLRMGPREIVQDGEWLVSPNHLQNAWRLVQRVKSSRDNELKAVLKNARPLSGRTKSGKRQIRNTGSGDVGCLNARALVLLRAGTVTVCIYSF